MAHYFASDVHLRFNYPERGRRFSRLVATLEGRDTLTIVGRPWREITQVLGLDPDHRMQHALDTRTPFGGVALNWPVDGGYLPVEFSGEPQLVDGHFAGFHGAGVCRDRAAIDRLEMLRRHKFSVSAPMPQALSSDSLIPRAANDSAAPVRLSPASEPPPHIDPDTPVEPPPPPPVQEPAR